MKKFLFFILTVLIGFCSVQMSAQTIVEIPATGTTTGNSYLPSYTFYNYSLTQQIYTSTEIGMSGTISSIAFYNSGTEKTRTYNMYLVLTDKTSFNSSSDWISVTANDQVFSGSVTMAANTWTTLTLDMPFSYDGTSNLALIMDDNTGSYSSGMSCNVFDAPSMAIRVYSDGTNYDPTSPNGYSGTVMAVKNQIRIEITPGDISCHAVGPVVVSNVTASNATLTWGLPEDGGTFLVQYKTPNQSWDDFDVVSDVAYDTTYDFLDMLLPNTQYNVRVANLCGASDTSVWRHSNFLTSNIAVQLPYSQDFETNPESITDFMLSNSGPNAWYIGSATGMQGDEPTVHSLYISNNNGTSNTYTNTSTADAYAVLDVVFEDTPMEWHLSFDYNVNGEGTSTKYDYLSVYVMDGGSAIPTSGAPSGTAVLYQSNLLSGWTHFDAILDGVVGSSKRIVFYWRNDSSSGSNPPAAVDNIEIVGYTCGKPSNIQLTSSTTNSISVTWTENGSATSWSVFYREHGTTDEYTEQLVSGTPTADLTGLNADTRYDIYVVAHCDDGNDSQASEPVSFRTQCGALTQLPYFNDFEDVISEDGTNFITCWSRYTTNPDRVVRCYGSATHNGSYALDFNYSPSCTTAAVTPMLDSSIPLNTVMLDFWAYSSLGQGWMEVGTMSDPADFSTYEFYDTVRLSTPNTWENLMISFENYTGSNQYIAFLEINGTSTSYIFDDFTINYIPSCIHPTNLAVEALTNTTVTLSWTEIGTASSWTIEYGPAGFTPGNGATVSANTNPFTVDNLTPATTYDFYVYSECGGDLSDPYGPVQATPGQYTFGVTGSDTLTTCGVILYDNGGQNGDYGNSCHFTLVIYPENPDAVIALYGTSSTESCCDYLRVYEGVGTSGQQLAEYKGENQTVGVMSQNGPLTLLFHSDGSVVKSGFAITATCVTCYPPTDITATNPTLDGATVSWNGTADSYVLFLNGDMTTGYDASGTTYTFTGLNPSSSYSVQVASLCDGDTSMLSSAATFSTACGAITITDDAPWTEDFESYTGSGVQQFICWERPVTQVVDNGTAPFVYCNYGEAAHSGTNTAEMKGSVNMLALPEFTNDLSELRISFWATGYSYTNTNVEIGYITDINDPTTFVPVIANAGVPGPRGGSGGGHGNFMGPFGLNGVSVSGARIALRYTGPGSSSGWNVDDFTVEIAPDCQSPVKTSVTATNIGGHVATISWVDNDPTHTSWTVYYKEVSDNDWSTVSAYDTSVVLTGLDPQTQYDVYVITNCGTPEANPDATHTISFFTTVACPEPTGLTLANVSTDEATITWNGTASSYNVEYGETGFTPGTGTVDVALTESFTLTNLDPSTSYTLYVNSDCSDFNDGTSTTATFTFSTTQVPADLPYTADFTVSNEWLLNNGTCTNYWTTGTVNNVPALFVTDNGTTPNYSVSSTSIVTAEKLLAVGDNASVVISFDVNVGGESSWDYLKVFFAPAESSYPAATSAPTYASYSYSTYAMDFGNYLPQTGSASYPYKLNLTQGNTLHVTAEMPNPYDNATPTSNAKLVFMWKNDASSGTQPPVIISNVSVIVNSCPMPSNLVADNITNSTADIMWTAGDSETEWEIEYGTHGFDHGAGTVESVYTTPSLTLSNLTPGTTYDVYVRAICNAGDSSAWVGPISVSPGTYNMPTSGNNSITTCDLTIYDDGGATGDYSSNCESYLTINPETSASLISISGTSSSESCCDYLRIYDGVGTSGTMLGEYKGENLTIPTLVSTTGPLTLHFHSDGSVQKSGFALTVVCISNTCPTPTNLTISNVTTTSADIAWTPSGSETTWNLEYKEASATTWTTIAVSGTPSYQLANLSTGTSYNIRVQADCSADDQSMWVNGTFTTDCDAINVLPYTEDFNSYTGSTYTDNNGIAPDCWITTSNNTTYGAPHIIGSGSYHYASSGNSMIFTCGSAGADAYAALPTFAAALNTLHLNFWRAMESTSSGTLSVGYVTNLADLAGSFVEVATIPSVSSSNGDTISVDFNSADIPAVGNICFHWNYNSSYYSCCIDDITVSDAGSGPVITNPTVATNAATAIGQHTATLNATVTNPDNVTITAKGFEWKTTTGGTFTQIAGTGTGNTFSANLNGLTANTGYTYKAFITFNGTTVYGSEMTFTTLPEDTPEPCDVPTGLTTGTITHESIAISWDANPNVSSWNIQYRPVGGTLSSATSTTNSYTITGLAPETQYEIQVQAVCSNGQTSDWSAPVTATTLTGINDHLLNSISLYPNPAKDVVYVQYTMNDVQVKAIEVFDVYGKLLQTVSMTPETTTINVSGLSCGMYFVRVTTEQGAVTKSFVKK